MATWHQQQAMARSPVPLWHCTQWTVVTDPPHESLTLERYDTPELANARLDVLKKQAKGKHSYVLPPAQMRRR